jgi:hypothetical protein
VCLVSAKFQEQKRKSTLKTDKKSKPPYHIWEHNNRRRRTIFFLQTLVKTQSRTITSRETAAL